MTALALASDELHPARDTSGDLLHELTPQQSPAGFQALCDRLAARLGADAVTGLDIRDEHLPEHASVARSPTAAATGAHPPVAAARPVWLRAAPEPVTECNGRLYWDGPLTLLHGPERIESAWWKTPARRDYYLARHGDGRRCWLYRDRRTGAWFVHGLFG